MADTIVMFEIESVDLRVKKTILDRRASINPVIVMTISKQVIVTNDVPMTYRNF